jgi:uncharacterized protein YidB (DUF937 family)
MSLMDDVRKEAGSLADLAARHPQAVAAVVSLLNHRDHSVGGTGGLGGLVTAFQRGGLGDVVNSWISTGPNPPVSATDLESVLGSDVLKQFAAKAGVSHGEAGGLLASLLPTVVDHLTPNGHVPAPDTLESSLGGLLSSLGR